ncbi:DUF4212 domain-containing protein [Microbacterium sp. BWT-B31]|uniref:heavy metal transporter n=1 Tax=Microbacterium sp. BWT-B31 TaxID=3232072 RepID=UPI00352980E1
MSDEPRHPPAAPARQRVTAAPSPRRPSTATRGIALPGTPAQEADAVFARGLRRAQLRLALGSVVGFIVVVAVLALVTALVPELDRATLWGVPLSWLLHAYGFYPVILVFAVLYVRAAGRNERRYRALRERE